ncbi:hypothetical protein EDB86DRAFT_3084409 [Lactarius hatsudake]|nr:hypothetical protein EDB86DRAFT_3084409 [Lactarius hatsudake]
MDIDMPASPSSPSLSHPPPSSSNVDGDSTSSRGLPFPGKVIDGVHALVHYDLRVPSPHPHPIFVPTMPHLDDADAPSSSLLPSKNLSKATLCDLCDSFHLVKTGNMATLMDQLKKFSADCWEWDGLLTGARNRHRGPQDAGVTRGDIVKPLKKKGTTKQSALRCELLFSDGAGLTTSQPFSPFLPTERSKDMCMREEKAELLAWATQFVTRKKCGGLGGPPHPAPALSPSSSQLLCETRQHPSTATLVCLRVLRWRGPGPEHCPRQADPANAIQAELVALMAVVTAASSSSAASSASSIVAVATTTTTTTTNGAPPSMATPPQATASHE